MCVGGWMDVVDVCVGGCSVCEGRWMRCMWVNAVYACVDAVYAYVGGCVLSPSIPCIRQENKPAGL